MAAIYSTKRRREDIEPVVQPRGEDLKRARVETKAESCSLSDIRVRRALANNYATGETPCWTKYGLEEWSRLCDCTFRGNDVCCSPEGDVPSPTDYKLSQVLPFWNLMIQFIHDLTKLQEIDFVDFDGTGFSQDELRAMVLERAVVNAHELFSMGPILHEILSETIPLLIENDRTRLAWIYLSNREIKHLQQLGNVPEENLPGIGSALVQVLTGLFSQLRDSLTSIDIPPLERVSFPTPPPPKAIAAPSVRGVRLEDLDAEAKRLEGVPPRRIDNPQCLRHLAERKSSLELQPHQLNVAAQLSLPGQRGLLGKHSTGSGKTLTAFAAIDCAFNADPTLRKVVALIPKSIQDHWGREFGRYGFQPGVRLIIGNKKYTSGAPPPGQKWRTIHVMNLETFKGQCQPKGSELKLPQDWNKAKCIVDLCEDAMLIIDEGHFIRTEIKMEGEQVKEGVLSYWPNQCARKARKILILTATPEPNDESDVNNLIQTVRGENYLSRAEWNRLSPEDKQARIRCNVSYYDSGISKLFPQVEEQYVRLVMTPEYQAEYEGIVEELSREQESKSSTTRGDGKNVAFYANLRRRSNTIDANALKSQKLDWITEKLANDWRGKKVIIFSTRIAAGIGLVGDWLDARRGIPKQPVIVTTKRKKTKKGDVVDLEPTQTRVSTGVNTNPNKLYAEVSGDMKVEERALGEARYRARADQVVHYNPSTKDIRTVSSTAPLPVGYQALPPVDIMLLGPAGRQGLNLLGTEVEVSMEPDWNETNQVQFKARGVRMYGSEAEAAGKRVVIYNLLLDKPQPGENPLNPRTRKSWENIYRNLAKDVNFKPRNYLDMHGIDVALQGYSFAKQRGLNQGDLLLKILSIEYSDC